MAGRDALVSYPALRTSTRSLNGILTLAIESQASSDFRDISGMLSVRKCSFHSSEFWEHELHVRCVMTDHPHIDCELSDVRCLHSRYLASSLADNRIRCFSILMRQDSVAGRNPDVAHDNIKCYSVIMVRTQISLTEEEYKAAKLEAERLGISLAELLRRSLRYVLPADESKSWMRYAGMVDSGDPHSSQRIDEIVYGQKK